VVAGGQPLEGKKLANAVKYRLSKAPLEVRKFYEGNFRYDRSSSSEQKQEFIKNLFSAEGFQSQFFKRLTQIAKVLDATRTI